MTIERARELLGNDEEKYSDDQIREIIINLETLADIAIETFKKLTPEERKKWLKKPKKKQHVKQ